MATCECCGQELPGGEKIPYEEIINDLNAVCKLKPGFKHTSKAHRELIRARWAEGHRLEDFKAVHRNQAAAWLGKAEAKYLRPVTLYCASKFEGYLNHGGPGGHVVTEEAVRAAEEILAALKVKSQRVSPFEGRVGRVLYASGGWIKLRQLLEDDPTAEPEVKQAIIEAWGVTL